MKHYLKRISLTALMVFVACCILQAQTNVVRHTVQKGETLYSLSRRYGVTVDVIKQNNPELQNGGVLKTGMVVVVPSVLPAAQVPTTDQPAAVLPEAGQKPECRTMHEVKRKETLYGIAKQYGITEEELEAANPDAFDGKKKKLKKGTMLCIPYAKAAPVAAPVVVEQPKPYRLAVVMPFTAEGQTGQRCVEFYRGLLMGVEEMKKNGMDIQVSAYDEPGRTRSMSVVRAHLREDAPQVLFGPIYPDHFSDTEDIVAEQKDMKWVMPFSPKYDKITTNDDVFMLNPPDEFKAGFVADHLRNTFKEVRVVFLGNASQEELAFTNSLRGKLQEKSIEFDELPAGYDLTAMIGKISPTKHTVFVPMVSKRKAAEAVLRQVAQVRDSVGSASKVALLGYPEWSATKVVSSDLLCKANTYVFMNHFYNAGEGKTRDFVSDYYKWFNVSTLKVYPNMYLLGYDSALYWLSGLKKHGDKFAGESISASYFQTKFRFSRAYDGGGYVNACTYFVHYAPSGNVSKVSAD